MSEHLPQPFEPVTADTLVKQARLMREQAYRLVQIGVTRLTAQFELTYSFDLAGRLRNFRLLIPATDPHVPSITGVYWGAFLYENEMHDLFGLRVEGIAVDFHGSFYRTTVKFPFGSTKPPVAKTPPAGLQPDGASPASPGTQPGRPLTTQLSPLPS